MIDKHKNISKGRLYRCFVDFRKTFDTVIHPTPFLKLQNIGVGDLRYNILKNMHKENILSLKINKKLSPNFNSEVGVRQGDTFRTNLFKVYINDLPSIFKDGCEPVELNSCKLNCLHFADDVVLLSKTAQGM